MGLLDLTNSDDGALGLSLLAAASPRFDGAGFGQRLMEGLNNAQGMKDAAMKRNMTQLQFIQAMRRNKMIDDAMAQDAAPGQTPVDGQQGNQSVSQINTQPWSPSKIRMFAMSGDPGLQKAAELEQARQLAGQTDIGKLMAQAGIDASSPLGKQITQQNIAKQNNIPLQAGRAGAPMYAADGSIVAMAPKIPDNAIPTIENGMVSGVKPLPGAADIQQINSFAIQAGKNQAEPMSAVDENGQPTFTNKFTAANGGGASGVPGNGLDLSKLSQEQIAMLAKSDPQAFALGVQRFQAQPPVVRPSASPGFNSSQDALAGAGAKRYNDTISLASDSPTRVNVYDNILKLSQEGVATGPGQEWKNKFKGYVANTPGLANVAGSWKDDVSGFQELNKFMYQNAQRNWQAAGGTGTDAQLEAFSHSNPNSTMFPQALQAMAQWGKAGEIALQGKANALQTWKDSQGGNVANQDQFEKTWRNNFDPRIFQLKTMSPDQAQAFVANLKKTDPNAYATLMLKAKALSNIGGL